MHPNTLLWLLTIFVCMACAQTPKNEVAELAIADIETSIEKFTLEQNTSEKIEEHTEIKEDSLSSNTMNLKKAMYNVLKKHPELEAISWKLKKRDMDILRAGLWQNPSLSFEVENFIGSNDQQAFDSAEFTLAFSQTIELGGKIAQKERIALIEKGIDICAYQEKQIEILSQVAYAFVELVATQENLKLSEELYDLTKEIHEAVKIRVESGKVSPIEATKTKIALTEIYLDNIKQKQQFETNKRFLVSLWGDKNAKFNQVEGNYYDNIVLPFSIDELIQKIDKHPKIQEYQQKIRQNSEIVTLEKKNQIPDITVDIGARFFNETEDSALVAGISIPIPIFNNNKENIAIAEFETKQTEQEMEATKLKMSLQLQKAYQNATTSLLEIQKLKEEIIVDAQTAFDSIKEGYQQGKFNYLDVLDAQRVLFDVRKRYIQVLLKYHINMIDIRSIVAGDGIGEKR